MSQSKYIVGIDLGTSNSILAYTPAEMDDQTAAEIHTPRDSADCRAGQCCRAIHAAVFHFPAGRKRHGPGRTEPALGEGCQTGRRRICPRAGSRASPAADQLGQILALPSDGGPQSGDFALGRILRKCPSFQL